MSTLFNQSEAESLVGGMTIGMFSVNYITFSNLKYFAKHGASCHSRVLKLELTLLYQSLFTLADSKQLIINYK